MASLVLFLGALVKGHQGHCLLATMERWEESRGDREAPKTGQSNMVLGVTANPNCGNIGTIIREENQSWKIAECCTWP